MKTLRVLAIALALVSPALAWAVLAVALIVKALDIDGRIHR